MEELQTGSRTDGIYEAAISMHDLAASFFKAFLRIYLYGLSHGE
jgi:hypothetical protein